MHWVILASTFGRYSNHIIDALLGDRLLWRSKGGQSKMLSHKSPRQSLMQKRAKNCSAGVQHCAIMIPCAQIGFGWEFELSHRIAVNTCDFMQCLLSFLVLFSVKKTKTNDGSTAPLTFSFWSPPTCGSKTPRREIGGAADFRFRGEARVVQLGCATFHRFWLKTVP